MIISLSVTVAVWLTLYYIPWSPQQWRTHLGKWYMDWFYWSTQILRWCIVCSTWWLWWILNHTVSYWMNAVLCWIRSDSKSHGDVFSEDMLQAAHRRLPQESSLKDRKPVCGCAACALTPTGYIHLLYALYSEGWSFSGTVVWGWFQQKVALKKGSLVSW